jgi:5-formyltetrahydrofolate cyclo-ligase
MSKSNFRIWAKAQVKSISFEDRRLFSSQIVRHIESWLSFCEYNESKNIYIFHGMPEEPWIVPLVERLTQKNFFLPRILDQSKMEFRKFDKKDQLSIGPLKIYEPSKFAEIGLPSRHDLIFVPCVSVTKDGARLGHGKGYYDRYLASLVDKPIFCGVAFDRVISQNNSWTIDSHDIRMDFIASESGVFKTQLDIG